MHGRVSENLAWTCVNGNFLRQYLLSNVEIETRVAKITKAATSDFVVFRFLFHFQFSLTSGKLTSSSHVFSIQFIFHYSQNGQINEEKNAKYSKHEWVANKLQNKNLKPLDISQGKIMYQRRCLISIPTNSSGWREKADFYRRMKCFHTNKILKVLPTEARYI